MQPRLSSFAGLFLAGLLQSGDVFLWHKDTDMLKTILGVPDLAMLAEAAVSSAGQSYYTVNHNATTVAQL